MVYGLSASTSAILQNVGAGLGRDLVMHSRVQVWEDIALDARVTGTQ